MKRCILASLIALFAISHPQAFGLRLPPGAADEGEQGGSLKRSLGMANTNNVRFTPVAIYIDSGDKPLAAYQFELKATVGRIKIVGVEGGSHAAFKDAPYYDPAALANDHIIIAAFNTGTDLPTGRTRIATVHLQITGDAEPQYELNLMAAANAEGQNIPAKLTLEAGETK